MLLFTEKSFCFFAKRFAAIAPALLLQGCSLFGSTSIPDLSSFIKQEAQVGARFIEQVKAGDDLRTFRTLVDTKAKSTLASERIKQVVAFERPGKLRIDFFGSSLNRLLGSVVQSGNVVTVLDTVNRQSFVGEAREDLFDSLLGLPFDSDELSLWFAGYYPFQQADSEVYFSKDGKSAFVKSTVNGRVLSFAKLECGAADCIDASLQMLSLFDLDDESLLISSRYRRLDSRLIGIDLDYPALGAEFEFRYQQPELNSSIDERVFRTRVPRSYQAVALERITFLGLSKPDAQN